jgi:hypothetical protein
MDKMSALFKEGLHLGVTVDQLESLRGAFSKAGLDPESVGSTLEKLQMHVAEAARGGEGGDVLKQLGLGDLSGQGAEDQFRTVVDALAKVQNAGERALLATKLFGREGGLEIANGFQHGSKAIDDAHAKLERFGLLLTDKQTFDVSQAKKAIDDYSLSFEGLWRQLTVSYAPAIKAFFDMLTEESLKAQNDIKGIGSETDPLEELFGGVLDAVQDIEIAFFGVRNAIAWIITEGAVGLSAMFGHSHTPLGNDLEAKVKEWDKEQQDRIDHPLSEEWKKRRDAAKNAPAPGGPAGGSPLDLQADFDKANRSTMNAYFDAQPLAKFGKELATLNLLWQKGKLDDEEYAVAVQKLGQSTLGVVDPFAKYNAELKEHADLAKQLDIHGDPIFSQKQVDKANAASLKAAFSIPDTATDSLKEYSDTLEKIRQEQEKGIGTAEQWAAQMGEANKKLGFGLSIDQQDNAARDKQRQLAAWAKANGISTDSQQYRDKQKEIGTDFAKQLREQTMTPLEKLGEQFQRLQEQKGLLSPELYDRGKKMLAQQTAEALGDQEHHFAGAQMYGSDAARETILKNQYGRDDTQVQMLEVLKDQLTTLKDMAKADNRSGENMVDAGL